MTKTMATFLTVFGLAVLGSAIDLRADVTNWGIQRWAVDADGNGTMDLCRVLDNGRGRSIACTLSPTKRVEDLYAGRTIESGILDAGYAEGRAFVDFDGDRRVDYCRVIGNGYPNSFVTCTFSNGETFTGAVHSGALDWGYPDSRKWMDVNKDGRADFCRVTGNYREYVVCTLSNGRQGFGKEIRDIAGGPK